MKCKPYIVGIVLALGALIISGCRTTVPEPATGLANPASVYCEEQGYTLEMRTDADGGTYGVCTFPDGSECEEWAFYRGECKPASASEAARAATPAVEPPAEEEPTEVPEPVPTEAAAEMPGVVYEGISFTFDHAIAAGVVAETVPATDEEGPDWAKEPAHVRFSLNGYVLPATFHEPRILVYPVAELEAISEYTARAVAGLRQLLVDRPAAPEEIPFLPLFNAKQMMRAQVTYVGFQNGNGVRFLTQYNQAYLPVNNHELFYTFQGLTDDGNTYVAAILPASHPALPADQMAYEGDLDTLAQDFAPYIADVEQQLDAQDGSSFTPDLGLLDAMIQSLEVEPDWITATPLASDGVDDPYPGWESYANADYGFGFRYPSTWTLEEEENVIKLNQGALLLAIAFQRQGEDVPPPWTGMPAGDFESRGTMMFLGREIEKRSLVYEGKVKALTYGAEVGDLNLSIRLDDTVTADYPAIDISETVQDEVDQIVESFEMLPASKVRLLEAVSTSPSG